LLCGSAGTRLIFDRFRVQGDLKGGRRGFAAVVPEDEFVEVNLELWLAHSVVGSDQPLLNVSNGAIGKRYSRLLALTEFGSQWVSSGDMFELPP
jgi:hypothetical protein